MKNLAALIVTTLLFAFSMSAIAGPYTLTITPSDFGRVSVSPVKEYYEAGDIITLTAIPEKGYTFVQFTYNGSFYPDNPLIVSPTRDMELSVEFVYSGYTINVDSTEGGTVTVDPKKDTYTQGEPVMITAVPNEGAVFDGFSGTISTDESSLLIYVDQNYGLTAHFHYADYSVTIEQTEGGTLTIDPDKPTYFYDEEVSYQTKTEPGYRFDKIEGYSEELTEPSGTITVKGDYYLVPRFVPEEYTVTLGPTEGGTVIFYPEKFFYTYGEELTIIAKPDPGYAVDSLTVNGAPIEGDSFTVTGHTEVEVLFSIAPEMPAGFGSADDPYQIATAGNLAWMSKHSDISEDLFFCLTADIDLSDAIYWRNGKGFSPIGTESAPFRGTFDGQNFTISNLYISTEDKAPQGLFGKACNCVIKNVSVNGYVKGGDKAALLVGYCDNVELAYCNTKGYVEGKYSLALLAGYFNSGTITCCTIEGTAQGTQFVGGIVGKALNATIANCLSSADLEGESCVGGIAGDPGFVTFTNCLALGKTEAQYDCGGIGGSTYECTATGCFFDTRKSHNNKLGTGITKEQIADKLTYTTWDFMNIWEFLPNAVCPTLRPASDFFWTPVQGESVTTYTLSCTLTKDDIEACNNVVFIYCKPDDGIIITPSIIPSLPVKEKELKVQYNQKKGILKYTSQNTLLTIGSFEADFAWPFITRDDKQKLTFTLTAKEDISSLFNKTTYSSLADPNQANHALSFTTVELTQKGNNLVYNGAQDGVAMKVKINTKNQKCTIKAVLQNTISLVTSPDPYQTKK